MEEGREALECSLCFNTSHKETQQVIRQVVPSIHGDADGLQGETDPQRAMCGRRKEFNLKIPGQKKRRGK